MIPDKDEKIPCGNLNCNIRMSCARANDEDYIGPSNPRQYDWQIFNCGQTEGAYCAHFVIRAKLGGRNPGELPTGRRGRRHNEHAPPRTSYPGSEELFGHIFKGKEIKANDRGKHVPLPKRPDLMVSRHLRNGRDIKAKEEE